MISLSLMKRKVLYQNKRTSGGQVSTTGWSYQQRKSPQITSCSMPKLMYWVLILSESNNSNLMLHQLLLRLEKIKCCFSVKNPKLKCLQKFYISIGPKVKINIWVSPLRIQLKRLLLWVVKTERDSLLYFLCMNLKTTFQVWLCLKWLWMRMTNSARSRLLLLWRNKDCSSK